MCQYVAYEKIFRSEWRGSERASGEAAKGSFLILSLALALARDLSRHLLNCDQAFLGLLPQKVYTDNREKACSQARYEAESLLAG